MRETKTWVPKLGYYVIQDLEEMTFYNEATNGFDSINIAYFFESTVNASNKIAILPSGFYTIVRVEE